jgi:dihydrofolate reductase
MLRRGQDRLRRVLPGGNLGGKGFALIALAALALWGFSGFFRVEPDELGVVLRFGKQVREVQPGLNYHLPYPVETVLTRDGNFKAPGTVVATSFDVALDLAHKDAEKRGTDEIMVIGGADIFAMAMPRADRLEFTRVHALPEGDVVFPPLDATEWREVRREPHRRGPDDDADFTILTYERLR